MRLHRWRVIPGPGGLSFLRESQRISRTEAVPGLVQVMPPAVSAPRAMLVGSRAGSTIAGYLRRRAGLERKSLPPPSFRHRRCGSCLAFHAWIADSRRRMQPWAATACATAYDATGSEFDILEFDFDKDGAR
jgi:hypothetical protein